VGKLSIHQSIFNQIDIELSVCLVEHDAVNM
jgi:hypothetical protein